MARLADPSGAPQRRLTPRRLGALALWVVLMGGAIYGLRWVARQPTDRQIPWPLRRVLAVNRQFRQEALPPVRLAATYPTGRAVRARVNGMAGLAGPATDSGYHILVTVGDGPAARTDTLWLDTIKARLPYRDLVFNFKCIEGWSQITWWGGGRFADLMTQTGWASRTGEPIATGREPHAYKYVGLKTPDGGYYVSLDMPSAMHPQTLLCWHERGEPLSQRQGFPIRLIIPVKYGVKSIKRIGRIHLTDIRPPDFWYERGYDDDLGH